MERAFFHSCFPISPCTHEPPAPWGAGLQEPSQAAIPPALPALLGILTPEDFCLPTDGLYWHGWGLSTCFNKNYFVWRCLRRALISFAFSLCFLCVIFSPKEKVLFYQFSCSSLELLHFVRLFLMFFPALWSLQHHVHSSVLSVPFPPVIHHGCHLPSNDIQMEVPCCQTNQC